jgi:hypothetical protein
LRAPAPPPATEGERLSASTGMDYMLVAGWID